MKTNFFLFRSIFVFLFALTVAYICDLRASAVAAFQEITEHDKELQINEQKMITQIEAFGLGRSELSDSLAAYLAAAKAEERRRLFSALLARVPKSILEQLDQDNLINRRALDEYLGTLNRRDLIEKRLLASVAVYNDRISHLGKRAAMLPERVGP